MALVPIKPAEATVRWDRRGSTPAEVRWTGHQVRVTRVAGVRDERAAYPAERGPRIVLDLDTADGGRARLVFDGRRRRWYVEALETAA